jgi:predicted dehydrogenase
MSPKWRVGLVGVGRGSGYGKLFADEPRCQVVACCDASEEALARFGRELNLDDSQCFTDYADFSQTGLDIVFVGTPIPFHTEQTIMALEAGAAVLSEVTMSNSVEGCQAIVDAVRRTGKTYMLAENCVYWHFVGLWRDIVQSGRIGEVAYAECEYLHPIPDLIYNRETGEGKWRFNRAPLHYCTHSLGPILDITGDRVRRVSGIGQGHRVLPEAPIGGIDIQVAIMETEKGAIIKLLRSSVMPRRPAIHFYSLHGTRGYLETDRQGPEGSGLIYIEGEMERDQPGDFPKNDPTLPPSAQAGGHGTAEYSLIQDFLAALEADRRPRIDEVRGMEMTVPGLLAHESALRDGQWLDVPQVG